MRDAIGLVETIGMIGAIEALDVALKSANVKFVNIEFIRAGIVTITISGDVGAVKAAVASSKLATQKLGCYRASHVIPRPSTEVLNILNRTNGSNHKFEKVNVETVSPKENESKVVEIKVQEKITNSNQLNFNELKVVELKDYIYNEVGGYSKNELKKMNKEKLLNIALNKSTTIN